MHWSKQALPSRLGFTFHWFDWPQKHNNNNIKSLWFFSCDRSKTNNNHRSPSSFFSCSNSSIDLYCWPTLSNCNNNNIIIFHIMHGFSTSLPFCFKVVCLEWLYQFLCTHFFSHLIRKSLVLKRASSMIINFSISNKDFLVHFS